MNLRLDLKKESCAALGIEETAQEQLLEYFFR